MPTEEHAVIVCRDFKSDPTWGEVTLFVTRMPSGDYRLDNATCRDQPEWLRNNRGSFFRPNRNTRTRVASKGLFWPTWEVVIQHHLWVYESKREGNRA